MVNAGVLKVFMTRCQFRKASGWARQRKDAPITPQSFVFNLMQHCRAFLFHHACGRLRGSNQFICRYSVSKCRCYYEFMVLHLLLQRTVVFICNCIFVPLPVAVSITHTNCTWRYYFMSIMLYMTAVCLNDSFCDIFSIHWGKNYVFIAHRFSKYISLVSITRVKTLLHDSSWWCKQMTVKLPEINDFSCSQSRGTDWKFFFLKKKKKSIYHFFCTL